jgi:hypothetical protein
MGVGCAFQLLCSGNFKGSITQSSTKLEKTVSSNVLENFNNQISICKFDNRFLVKTKLKMGKTWDQTHCFGLQILTLL